jgi:tRNA nucleotidyltransferase (CCA-adding enzyme)
MHPYWLEAKAKGFSGFLSELLIKTFNPIWLLADIF